MADELVGSDTHMHKAQLVNTLQEKLDSISASAKELLAQTPQEKSKSQQPGLSLDEKLADFYGARQVDGHVVFSSIYPRAKSVQVAGDFNSWDPSQTELRQVDESGKWQLSLPIEKGLYRYRLVVDGQWQQDPYNDWIEMNPFGEFNSVLSVQ